MNLRLIIGLFVLTLPASAVDPSSDDPITEALPLLQAGCPDFASLNYKPGDKLSDLIARSNGKISLQTATTPTPILTASLPDNVIYWRLASFQPKKDWADLANDLRTMIDSQHVAGAVLDLRSNAAPEDYVGAAQVLALFASGDATLVKFLPREKAGALPLPTPLHDRQFQGPLLVLVNDKTTGAAEVLAACLKNDGALLVGKPTTGVATYVEERKLASGQSLRFTVAAPPRSNGSAPLTFPVVPDIALSVDARNEKTALMLIRDDHLTDVIGESAERHRMSEASLVQGQDPEWDDYLASMEKGPVLLSLPQVRDPVLIAALDSLRAIRLSQRPTASQSAANTSPPAASSL